jgi:hypothetical protein
VEVAAFFYPFLVAAAPFSCQRFHKSPLFLLCTIVADFHTIELHLIFEEVSNLVEVGLSLLLSLSLELRLAVLIVHTREVVFSDL